MPMHPLRHTLTCLGLLAASAAATAATGATWVCALSGDGVRLHCLADDDLPVVQAVPESSAAPGPTEVAARVNGVAFPLDRHRLWTVDLWSPPTDAGFVRLLAQATICHRSPGCSVVMAPSPWLQLAAVDPTR